MTFIIPGDVLTFNSSTAWSELDYQLYDSISYVWKRRISGTTTVISGQTSISYVVQVADLGYEIICDSTATNERGSTTVSAISPAAVSNPEYTFAFSTSSININTNAFISLDNIEHAQDNVLVNGKVLRYWSGDYTQHSLFYKSDNNTFRIYQQLIGTSSTSPRDMRVIVVFTNNSSIAQVYLIDSLDNTADIFGNAPWRAYQFDQTLINSYQTHLTGYKYTVPMSYVGVTSSIESYPTSDIPTIDNNRGWIRLPLRDGQALGGTSIQLRANMFIPSNITSLTATRSDSSQINISWSGSNANLYKYLITSSGGTVLSSGNTTSTSISVSGAVVGTTYTISITPNSRSDATGVDGNVNSISYIHPGPPSAPTSLSATPGANQVSLNWQSPSDGGSPITDYIIEYKLNTSSTWTVINDGTNTNTSYVVTGLSNGTSYNFRVAAVNIYGTSGYSSIATATPATVPGQITSIGGTTSVSGGTISRTVTWSPPDNGGSSITSYTAQLGINWNGSAGTWLSQFIYNGSSTSASFSGLTAATTYYVRVRATNAIGNGLYPEPNIITNTAFTTPNVPFAPSLASISIANAQASLSWSTPSDGGSAITDYRIQRSTDNVNWTTLSDGVSTSTFYTNTGLSNGTTYYFRVAAINAVGVGTYSNVRSVKPGTVPNAPSVSASRSGSTITVNWSGTGNGGYDITGWTLQRRVNGGAWGGQLTYPVETRTQVYTSLPSGTHEFRVFATNAIGNSAWGLSNAVVNP